MSQSNMNQSNQVLWRFPDQMEEVSRPAGAVVSLLASPFPPSNDDGDDDEFDI